jgi:transcriptional regulator with XRE-family HTH domain
MKTIGEQAKEFREAKGWNTSRMAKEVGTSRQSIENLEAAGDRTPRYIKELARVMGTTVDALMAGPSPHQLATVPPQIGGQAATLAQTLESLRGYLLASDNHDAVSGLLAKLAQNPEDVRTVAAILAMLDAPFAQQVRKAA